jgi:probable dihydroxyacetone kinase regulator
MGLRDSTKRLFACTIEEMMETIPLEKIRVKDLCSRCGADRQSFYYHFKDKYDLVNWIFLVGFLSKMNIDDYETGWDAVKAICHHFYADRDFYRVALTIHGQNSFHDYVIESIRPIMYMYINDIIEDTDLKDFFVTFYCDAFLTAITRWLSEGMKMNDEEFVGKLKIISVGLAKIVIRDEDK